MHTRRLRTCSTIAMLLAVTVTTLAPDSAGAASPTPEHRARVVADPTGAARGRVIVTYRGDQARTDAAREAVERRLAAKSRRLTRRFHFSPTVVVEAGAREIQRLAADPAVVSIVPDLPQPAADFESTALVGATATHAGAIDGTGTTVAVLDTGVDATHPFLAGKVVFEACFAASGSCPNGQTSQLGAGAGAPCTYAARGCRHGTHVAGIAAGRHTDTIPFDGVAPGADIMALQVFTKFEGTICDLTSQNESPCTLSLPSDRIAAMEVVAWLSGHFNVAGANMSIGGGLHTTACDTDPQKPIIDLLRERGVATTISAGNDASSTSVSSPGCISSAVTVGATTKTDAFAGYTNSNALVDVVAPGSSISSSIPGGGMAFFNGTSMAAPHVMGAFAFARQLFPDQDLDVTQAQIVGSGPVLTDARNGRSFHRLDVLDAFHAVQIDPGFIVADEGDSGSRTVDLPLTLSRPSTLPVSIVMTPYAITTDGADLVATETVVTFAPGEVEAIVPIEIIGDTFVEGDELFLMYGHDAQNGAVGGFLGLGVLVIHDEPTG